MKTVFDDKTRQELVNRVKTLDQNSTSQWGKMNIYQMLKHCTLWEEWVQGKNPCTYKQAFIGFLFGKFALRRVLKDEKPLDRNVPTSPEFKIKEQTGDINALKAKWITLLAEYENFDNPDFVHDFFGKMTKEQIGFLAYKHSDHHLRQFGA